MIRPLSHIAAILGLLSGARIAKVVAGPAQRQVGHHHPGHVGRGSGQHRSNRARERSNRRSARRAAKARRRG